MPRPSPNLPTTTDDNALIALVTGDLEGPARLDLERRVLSDPVLSARAAELRSAYEAFASGLAADDAATPLPVSEEVAVRQVAKAIKQWQVDRFLHEPPAPEHTPIRIPVWAYAAAVCIALFGGFCIWWANNPLTELPPVVNTNQIASGAGLPGEDEPPADPAVTYEQLPLPFQNLHAEATESLRDLERDVRSLTRAEHDLDNFWGNDTENTQ